MAAAAATRQELAARRAQQVSGAVTRARAGEAAAGEVAMAAALGSPTKNFASRAQALRRDMQ